MRVVVITGSSGGLGRALALKFSREGDQVILHYSQSKKEAEETARKVRTLGPEAPTFQADLRDRTALHQMVKTILQGYQRIDLWINNAGITVDRPLARMSERDWDRVMETNLRGAFYGTQESATVMIRQKSGHIINISSLIGLKGHHGQAAYAASKAGLIGLTKSSARELGPYHIQVNAILPGILPTGMTRSLTPDHLKTMIAENTLGHSTHLEEVSNFIHHLSGMQNVSGQVFNLDSRIT